MKSTDLTNEISFHDSTLIALHHDGADIELELDSVAASLSIVGEPSESEYVLLEEARVRCHKARTTALEFWTDTKAPIEHPNPDNPMREIMKNELNGDLLQMSGWAHENGWVEWAVQASRFTVSWSGETRVNLPKAEQ